ncbi:MAG: response regulator [Erythrobacter sp.]|uniref:response regulator n=1 Tax=Erythrobacter sp. TaxID=1042 RepID=UPI003C784F11
MINTQPEADESQLPADVLVVEDSLIIALDIEETIEQLGVDSVRIESTVAGALKAIEQRQPDFAIVDYNLGEENCQLVARDLVQRGVRFVVATGYANAIKEIDELGASGVLTKPYGAREIERALTQKTA